MAELIANTGIQFIIIPLNLDIDNRLSQSKDFAEEIIYDEEDREESGTLLFPYYWEEYDRYIDKDSINAEAIDRYGNVNDKLIKPEFVKDIDKESIYKVRAREALDVYAGHWMPIPYFRLKNDAGNPYHTGPQNWCRMWIGESDFEAKNRTEYTHQLVLAFDTTLDSNEYSDYLKPSPEDASISGNERFKCVSQERYMNAFYSREDIGQWLANVYDLKTKSGKRSGYFRHFANYLTLLEMLDKVGAFPEVSLLDGQSTTIDTAIVLDIGNSRTCGLIVETSNPSSTSSFDMTSVKRLQLRDLSAPYKVYENPFEMQIAFAEEKFGNEATDLIEGNVFNWPSLVRIGPEAVRLTSLFESEDSLATMSSPKRYLWDEDLSALPWIKVDKDGAMGYHNTVNLRKSALFGIAEHLSSDGKVLVGKKQGRQFTATESRYSRSSLMTFGVFEMICHALAQMNSVDFRKNMGNSSFKRVLKNIVVTCPTAMTKREQGTLRKAVRDAVQLAKLYYDSKLIHEDVKVHPDLVQTYDEDEDGMWTYDEATCSQIAFLYGELSQKFKGKHDLFFKFKGKKREGTLFANRDSVNIASIDIGGGTTDLMICNYQVDPSSQIPFVKPKPIFWEGFNIAGDDIVKRIIEFIIIPGIETHIRGLGGGKIEETINFLFGPDMGGSDAKHRIYRKQFATQIATFCAYAALDHISNENALSAKVSMNQIFQKYPKPKNDLIPYLESTLKEKCGLDSLDFMTILLEFNPKRIEYAISDIIYPVIQQLTQLVGVFDCDLLLLSGKSSALPIIKNLFRKTMAMSPDRIISLANYRFGNWYPFANPLGDVKDPKTTVSVGALIGFMSSMNRLTNFRIDLSGLNGIGSTAKYIGVMKESRISKEDLIFDDHTLEGTFSYYGSPVFIGMRQLSAPSWISTPLYVFDFGSDEYRERMDRDGFQYPFKVTATRNEEDPEGVLEKELIIIDNKGDEVDAAGYFKFKFKTMVNETGYWRDTGSFLVNIVEKVND